MYVSMFIMFINLFMFVYLKKKFPANLKNFMQTKIKKIVFRIADNRAIPAEKA